MLTTMLPCGSAMIEHWIPLLHSFSAAALDRVGHYRIFWQDHNEQSSQLRPL
jgi:hypothetical protein